MLDQDRTLTFYAATYVTRLMLIEINVIIIHVYFTCLKVPINID